MNEKEAAEFIRKTLEKDEDNLAEFPINDFIKLWFNGKQFTELDLVDKLLSFSKKYKFGYVLLLGHKKQIIAIRFWPKKVYKELSKEQHKKNLKLLKDLREIKPDTKEDLNLDGDTDTDT